MTNEDSEPIVAEPIVTEPTPPVDDQVAANNRRAFSLAARASFAAGLAWAGTKALQAVAHLNRLSVIRGIADHSLTRQDASDADQYVRWAYWASIAAVIGWVVWAVIWQRRTFRLLGIVGGTGASRRAEFHEALQQHRQTWRSYDLWRASGVILLVVAWVLPTVVVAGDTKPASLAQLESLDLRRAIVNAVVCVMVLIHTMLSWRARRAIESTPFVVTPPRPPRPSSPRPPLAPRGESPTVGWGRP